MSIGVIVGRFQNYELHQGHKDLIRYAASENDCLVFMIATQDCPPNKKNPLNYMQRVKVLEDYLNNELGDKIRYFIHSIVDHNCDKEWSKRLDNCLKIYYPDEQVILYCGRDGFNNHYFGSNDLRVFHPKPQSINISNSQLRKEIDIGKFNQKSFLAGVIYNINSLHPRVYTTVDIAVTKKYKSKHIVLMGTKFDGDKFRFPGGFVDPSESFENAARRELLEETGLLIDKLNYVGNFIIDDWRTNTGYNDVFTKTVFFQTDFDNFDIEAKANDDLVSVGWVPLDTNLEEIHYSHVGLFQELKKFLKQ